MWWLPTLLWLSIQAAFSTDTFSADHTGTVLWRVIHALFGSISQQHFEQIHFFVRKSAHFCSYGLLSVFAFFSWKATLPAASRWMARWSGLALLLTLVAASLDEFHQSFVPSRTSSWHDIALDMTGAIVFQVILAWYLRRRSAEFR